MMGRTHLAFGLLAALLLVPFLSSNDALFFVPLVLFGALLPDVDHEGSAINRRLPITRWIPWLFRHRGFFHSVYPPLVFIVVAGVYGYWFVGIAIASGYMVHLLTDSLTRSGVRFLYPIRWELRGPLSTGGILETFIFLVIAAVDGVLLMRLL